MLQAAFLDDLEESRLGRHALSKEIQKWVQKWTDCVIKKTQCEVSENVCQVSENCHPDYFLKLMFNYLELAPT